MELRKDSTVFKSEWHKGPKGKLGGKLMEIFQKVLAGAL